MGTKHLVFLGPTIKESQKYQKYQKFNEKSFESHIWPIWGLVTVGAKWRIDIDLNKYNVLSGCVK